MTAAAEDGGGDRRDYSEYRAWYAWVLRHTRWIPPVLMWIGHYALWVMPVYIVAAIAADATGRPYWSAWVGGAAIIAFWGAIIIDNSYHSAKLCERCMGATPLDPQAAVERWKPALKADHRNKLILLILLANFVWVFGVGNVLVDGAHWAGIPKHHDVWAYFLQDLSTLIIIPAYWLIQRVHRDLYPWCPWCHWDDGGDEEKVPDPDPEDHGVKPPVLS